MLLQAQGVLVRLVSRETVQGRISTIRRGEACGVRQGNELFHPRGIYFVCEVGL